MIVLSDKSSGSSALLRCLLRHPTCQTVSATPHHEQETLFWVKAAAALRRPEVPVLESTTIPFGEAGGWEAFRSLLVMNGVETPLGPATEAFVFNGWNALVATYGPVFVDKTPHYLHSWPTLDLLLHAQRSLNMRFRFIGLVRDPLDTLHSMWRRWSIPPERRQWQWARAYRNLLRLQEETDDVRVVTYEDLVTAPAYFDDLATWIGLSDAHALARDLQASSVGSGVTDARFGFRPAAEIVALARSLGLPADYPSPRTRLWPARRAVSSMRFRLRPLRRKAALLRRNLVSRRLDVPSAAVADPRRGYFR